MDHYIILNWVENSGSYTKSHGMPPRPLWVCLQEQWPVDCTHFCMPLLPLSLNTSFFAAGCMLSKKSQQKHLCLRLFFEGLVWSLAFLTSHKSSKNLFNKVLMNELLVNTQTTHNNLQQSVQTASSFEYCVSHDRYREKNDDTNQKWWFQQSCKFGRLRWSWLTLLCKRTKEYRGASSSEDSLDTSANDLADSCPNANRSWHHFGMTQHIPTWPNYPLRLPLATLQLVRLKTSPARKVTSNRCLTWTNTQHSCKSCTCNLVICISQVASMTLPASWHALRSFSVVLGSPVRIAAKQLYLHRCRRYKRTKSVSRKSKNRCISISSISTAYPERSWYISA